LELIRYQGWPVALADADEVHLHPTLLALAELGHALVRFVCTLALHAFEVSTGLEHQQRRAEGRRSETIRMRLPGQPLREAAPPS
jgi:hypothetical protein